MQYDSLLKNMQIKGHWQELSKRFGKLIADKKIANQYSVSLQEVKKARYYW
jgi:DNA-directed RNA polymerase specialized sigma subunit